MKNFFIASFTILLLIFASCENDFVQEFDDLTEETIGLQTKNGLDNYNAPELDTTSPQLETTSAEAADRVLETEDTSAEPDIRTVEIDPLVELQRDDDGTLEVDAINVDCAPDSKFIIRATYNDQSNELSFEYFDNSANSSTAMPIDIVWQINNQTRAAAMPPQSGATAESADFDFDNIYTVGVTIAFDDNTSFLDEFCLNIDRANSTAFNVCSDHETAETCTENSRGGNKKLLVVVDMVF